VSDCRLGDGAHVALVRLEHIWVVGWEDSSGSADNGAEGVVHLLSFRLVDALLEDGTLCRSSRGRCDGWVRAEVVVVIGSRAYNWALSLLVSNL
jgi:hypothetical protein